MIAHPVAHKWASRCKMHILPATSWPKWTKKPVDRWPHGRMGLSRCNTKHLQCQTTVPDNNQNFPHFPNNFTFVKNYSHRCDVPFASHHHAHNSMWLNHKCIQHCKLFTFHKLCSIAQNMCSLDRQHACKSPTLLYARLHHASTAHGSPQYDACIWSHTAEQPTCLQRHIMRLAS